MIFCFCHAITFSHIYMPNKAPAMQKYDFYLTSKNNSLRKPYKTKQGKGAKSSAQKRRLLLHANKASLHTKQVRFAM